MKCYIPYNDIVQQTQQGMLELCVDDAGVWSEPIAEFRLNIRIEEPLRANLTLIPVRPEVGTTSITGIMVRGTLTGQVVQECDRCAEDAPTHIRHTFEIFETVPTQDDVSLYAKNETGLFDDDADDGADGADDTQNHFVYKGNALVLDVGALCWEEFMLALPMRPLCKQSCKGLCTHCGTDLNSGTCACKDETGDPRLAALRALKIQS